MTTLKQLIKERHIQVQNIQGLSDATIIRLASEWLTEKAIEINQKYAEAQEENLIQMLTGAKITIRELLKELE